MGEPASGGSDAVLMTTIIVGAAGTIIANLFTFLTLWVRLRYGVEQKADDIKRTTETTQRKVDDNTKITQATGEAAVSNARAAATSATVAKAAAEDINRKLNGGIDSTINRAVDPIRKMLDEHSEKIEALDRYVHERNHDLLNEINKQSLKIDTLIELMRRQQAEGR